MPLFAFKCTNCDEYIEEFRVEPAPCCSQCGIAMKRLWNWSGNARYINSEVQRIRRYAKANFDKPVRGPKV